jgi:hypothetical protein
MQYYSQSIRRTGMKCTYQLLMRVEKFYSGESQQSVTASVFAVEQINTCMLRSKIEILAKNWFNCPITD